MRYINLETNEVHLDVRGLFPNSSLPEVLNDENLAELGFATVDDSTPACDFTTHKLVEGPVVNRKVQWDIVPLTDEELRPRKLAQVQALESQQARTIREAVLTGDKSRLAAIEKQIAELMGRNPVA